MRGLALRFSYPLHRDVAVVGIGTTSLWRCGMKKLSPCSDLRHRAGSPQYLRVLSLTSACLLSLFLAAPAWAAEKYIKSASPVFLEATPDFFEGQKYSWRYRSGADGRGQHVAQSHAFSVSALRSRKSVGPASRIRLSCDILSISRASR